jgi:hypothetical protein
MIRKAPLDFGGFPVKSVFIYFLFLRKRSSDFSRLQYVARRLLFVVSSSHSSYQTFSLFAPLIPT